MEKEVEDKTLFRTSQPNDYQLEEGVPPLKSEPETIVAGDDNVYDFDNAETPYVLNYLGLTDFVEEFKLTNKAHIVDDHIREIMENRGLFPTIKNYQKILKEIEEIYGFDEDTSPFHKFDIIRKYSSMMSKDGKYVTKRQRMERVTREKLRYQKMMNPIVI